MTKPSLIVLSSVVSLVLAGCGNSKSKDGEANKAAASEMAANKTGSSETAANKTSASKSADSKAATEDPAASAKPAEPAAPPAVTLVSVSQGDMGCYLEVEDAKGEVVTHVGGFDLCPDGDADASALEGKKVRLTIAKEQIPAGSCESDPECTETEEADVVTAVVAAE